VRRLIGVRRVQVQVQERLTAQVAQYLKTTLQLKAVGVVLEAEHLCMSLRAACGRGARGR
jgi:GTP cyclohydrolase IA